MARILMPLPACDYDPTEAAISWKILHDKGHEITFATPDGKASAADEIILTGRGLDVWSNLPLIGAVQCLGMFIRASKTARKAHQEMEETPAYQYPIQWQDIKPDAFDGLILPGGHRARGMRPYLESTELQQHVVHFFTHDKPVAAICHGVLLAARSIDPATGRSVLHGRKTTGLTWALENKGWQAAKIGRSWDPEYMRTYVEAVGEPVGYMSVESEVKRTLANPEDFYNVPQNSKYHWHKTSTMVRDSMTDNRPAFVVEDGRYVSARWPGDAHSFALRFATLIDTY